MTIFLVYEDNYDLGPNQVHKLFSSEEDANCWAKEQGESFYVEEMGVE